MHKKYQEEENIVYNIILFSRFFFSTSPKTYLFSPWIDKKYRCRVAAAGKSNLNSDIDELLQGRTA